MKKEKSKIIFSILTVIITIILILNAHLQFEYSECVRKIDEIRITSMASNYREYNYAVSNLHFLYTNLNFANLTNFQYSIDDEGKCTTTISTKLPKNCTRDWLEWPFEVLDKINETENQLNGYESACNDNLLFIRISLYTALGLSLIVTFYGWSISRQYKSKKQ